MHRRSHDSGKDCKPLVPDAPHTLGRSQYVTVIVRKAMKRMKRDLGLTNLEVGGEIKIDDVAGLCRNLFVGLRRPEFRT